MRDVGHGTFPDDLSVPAQIKGTTFQTTISVLQRMTQGPCEYLNLNKGFIQKSILPNFDFFIFLIFAFKLGHFKVQTIFSYATNTQA
jgi:hypothetical protein